MKKFTLRQWMAIVFMELIILAITAFLGYEFAIGVVQAKAEKTPISSLAIFCLVMAVIVFVGLNVLMVFMIKHMRSRR